MNIEIGSTLGGYRVIGILGAGGMGKVYKVRNLISDRVEAMKVLLPDLSIEPTLADRFLREIKVQASLEHPNIDLLYTALRVENQLLMLMEFVEGVTLEQKLTDGPLPAAQAVDYVMQALSALEYAHGRGVIHRDIKPANMMLTPGGVVKLMDFGIAKTASDRKLTMTGTTMGSLYYMSPEQIQGSTILDGRSDLYSLGVSLYELVTGKRPFDGDSQLAILSAHLDKAPIPPISLDPRLPQILSDVILKSVSRDPNERFQTAADFRQTLTRVTAPAPILQRAGGEDHLTAPEKTRKSPGGSRRWLVLGAAAAALGGVALYQLRPRPGREAASEAVGVPAATGAPVPGGGAETRLPTAAPGGREGARVSPPKTGGTERPPGAQAPMVPAVAPGHNLDMPKALGGIVSSSALAKLLSAVHRHSVNQGTLWLRLDGRSTGRVPTFPVGEDFTVKVGSSSECHYALVHRDSTGTFELLLPKSGAEPEADGKLRNEELTVHATPPGGEQEFLLICAERPIRLNDVLSGRPGAYSQSFSAVAAPYIAGDK